MLLGPVRYPRYILIEESGRVYAVPEQLAGQKNLAEGFARVWAKNIDSCAVVYARSKKGKTLLREVWKSVNSVQGTMDIVEIWQ